MKIIIWGDEGNSFISSLLTNRGDIIVVSEKKDALACSAGQDMKKIILVNKREAEALELKQVYPESHIFICHGGGIKDFYPVLAFIDRGGNHQYFLFENLNDFWQKIQSPPLKSRQGLLLERDSASTDVYTINFHNLPEMADWQKIFIKRQAFWFSLYFSRAYLGYQQDWVEMSDRFDFHFSFQGDGGTAVKKLTLKFNNIYRDQLMFREGIKIIFFHASLEDEDSDQTSKTKKGEKKELIGSILRADEKGATIIFEEPVLGRVLKKFNSFRKQDSLLAASIRRYLKSFGTDYLYRRPGLQLRPEDFFRGGTPNVNFNFPEINQVILDRRSKLILQDQFQLRALLNILSPSFLSLIRGGPGTGKTLLAAVAIKQFIINNQVVIITSHSNQALDNLLAAVGEHVDGDYIFRLGNDIKQIANKSRKYHRHWRYQSMTSSYGQYWGRTAAECEIDSQGREIEELLNNGQGLVLAVTLDSYQSDNFLRSFGKKNSSRQINLRPNIAFVDEATKANFYQLWPIIKSVSNKLVFFGDPDQLGNIDIPPVILNKLIKHMIESLSNDPFYKVDIGRSNGDCLPSIHVSDQELAAELAYFNKGPFRRLINENFPTSDLLINRRSLPAIVKMINYVFGKNLICGRFNPNNEGEVVVLDVEGEAAAVGTSYFNKGEACLVRQELLKYFFGQSKLDPNFNFNSVATIASYQGQVLSIREKLRQDLLFRPMFKHLVNPGNLNEILFELINSVDKFQGGERDAIFVSFVSANKIGWLGFNTEVERFFVAATRARNLLVIFLNADTFLHSDEDIKKISGRLIHYTQQKKTYSKKRVY